MKKRWKIVQTDTTLVQELQEKTQLDSIICQLLVQRGLHSPEEVHSFLHPSLDDLHDPYLMKDMDKAVNRLNQAIQQEEKILLYGDYDVDGTTSVALMHSFLENFTDQLDYYIPDRYKEGYGVSLAGIDYAQQNGISLIIAMDCGIKAIEAVAFAKKKGIDFIICDHHLPEKTLPEAIAVLDPKRSDCGYPYKELCGCGVSFKLVQAFAQAQKTPFSQLTPLLDLLAIAIACDIVPMTGENRALTHAGLQQLNNNPRLGIKALIEESKRPGPLAISDVVFGIGPMINAAGRLLDAKESVKLLLSKDEVIASKLAFTLHQQNEKRKSFDRTMLEEAQELFERMPDWKDQNIIVLYQPHWHKGVVGIAASRMAEKYNRPAIMLTESAGKIVGSARTVGHYNIHEAISTHRELLVNFGGHQHAAGLTLLPENLSAFQTAMESTVKDTIQATQLSPELAVCAILPFEKINTQFWNSLQSLAPFGPKNRNPIFVTENLEDTGDSRLLKNNHLKLSLTHNNAHAINGIAFGQGNQLAYIKEHLFQVCYNLQENNWRGRKSIQLNVKDIK